MDDTTESRLRQQLADCETLLSKLESRLPSPALEWPIVVLRYAIEKKRQMLRELH